MFPYANPKTAAHTVEAPYIGYGEYVVVKNIPETAEMGFPQGTPPIILLIRPGILLIYFSLSCLFRL